MLQFQAKAVYMPLPAQVSRLFDITPTALTIKNYVHPKLVEGLPPETILRLQKYSLWTKHMTRDGKKTMEQVVKEDLAKYKTFNARKDFQVLIHCVYEQKNMKWNTLLLLNIGTRISSLSGDAEQLGQEL